MGKASLYLVGFMGAGKTSVGKVLGEWQEKQVIDTDEYIVQQEKMTINDIFSKYGESYFRRCETETLKIVSKKDAIITTGGGIILDKQNREFLKSTNKTIFLQCHPTDVISRLEQDDSRPLIRDKSLDQIIAMYDARLPLYHECAALTIDTADKSIEMVAKLILECMN